MSLPELAEFADNGLGVAAFENGEMLGFLCCYKPWEGFTNYARGVFSPAHAHGAVMRNRDMIYKRMYEAAAEKWAKQGASWHALALYAHDEQAIQAMFTYGFGLRCIDAMRPMEAVDCDEVEGYTFREFLGAERYTLRELNNKLIEHLGKSPIFMHFPPFSEPDFEKMSQRSSARYFAACYDGRPIAYLKVDDGGEHFAADDASVRNICGAFCLPEHRGKGIYQNLLNHAISVLLAEGYLRLGVDCESFNPTAYGFWLKYFTPYTHSVVRRIDEKILEHMN